MSEHLTKEAFRENLNTEFRVTVEPTGSITVTLVDLLEGVSTPTQEQFSLTFRGPLEAPFVQGARNVEHDKMGRFLLFLVPIAKEPHGMIYEAVFNRLVKTNGND